MDILKPFHAFLWAIWIDLKQPKWLVPLLDWFAKKREGYL